MKPQSEPPAPQLIGDTMTNEIEKLKTELKELADKVSEQDDLIKQLNEELEHSLEMAKKIDEIIAAWNNQESIDDFIHLPRRRRPASDYAMTDQEWKEATHVPHPREWKKKFDPTTGEFQ